MQHESKIQFLFFQASYQSMMSSMLAVAAAIRGAKGWPIFLPLLLIVAILAVAVFSFYIKYQRYLDFDEQLRVAESQQLGATAADVVRKNDSEVLAESMLWLFGVADKKQKPAPLVKNRDVPPTPLKLRLLAVMAADDDKGKAIIAELRGKEQGYRVGEQIPGDAILDQVLVDRVIISRNGRQETLALTDRKITVDGMSGQSGRGRLASGRVILQESSSNMANQNFETGDSRVLPEFARYKAILASDPGSLSNLLRFRPVRQGQTLRGYRVFPGRNPTLLARAGLRVGDIITSANGVPLTSEEAGRMAIAQLASIRSLQLEVLRNGKRRVVTLAVQ